jgi:hypothetical protein
MPEYQTSPAGFASSGGKDNHTSGPLDDRCRPKAHFERVSEAAPFPRRAARSPLAFSGAAWPTAGRVARPPPQRKRADFVGILTNVSIRRGQTMSKVGN